MGCSSCQQRAAASLYPKEVSIGGETVLVTSAADERAKRAQLHARERSENRLKGYTATRH